MSRPKNRRAIIIIGALLALAGLLAACSTPAPDSPNLGNGLGTGISVAPEFEKFYEEKGGAQIFGFPISTALVDSESGRLTQYFQQLCLEFDETAETVIVSPLGEYFAPPEAEQVPAPGKPNGGQRTFPDTGFTVQDAFLAFYEANGGEGLFGPPITPQLDEGGTLVQYFQNVQLIWNPNAPPEFRVELASLGDAYYWQIGGPGPESFTRIGSASIPEADVRATLKEPILYAGEEQVLYVTVITPNTLQLVEGATVKATVSYDSKITEILLPATDEMGQTYGAIELSGVDPGEVVRIRIDVMGLAESAIGETMLSFRTWW
ncbi:MAG: hypothetical protein WAM60_05475 [Candidatus Promineifilaceae bacterium]